MLREMHALVVAFAMTIGAPVLAVANEPPSQPSDAPRIEVSPPTQPSDTPSAEAPPAASDQGVESRGLEQLTPKLQPPAGAFQLPPPGTIPTCTANISGYTPGPIVAPTHYLWIPPVAFSLNRELPVVGIDRGPNSLVAARIPSPTPSNTSDATASFDAPLNLAKGIVIRQVEVFLEDSDATKNMTVSMKAYGMTPTGATNSTILVSLESNCLTGPGTVTAKGMAALVDTNLWAYSINATWVVGVTDYYKLKLHRVRIGYTLQ